MKTIFLTILGFFVVLCTFGQSYHPLIRPNTFWDVEHGDGSQICGLSGGGRYFFQGDTTILGIQYQKLYYYPMLTANPGPFCPPFVFNSTQVFFAGLFREDTVGKKIYSGGNTDNVDVLLFDFSLAAGDTLKNITLYSDFTFIIDSVGTVTLSNGDVRKIFYLNDNGNYIESIGGSEGFFNWPIQAIGAWEISTCVTENSIHLYCSDYYGFVGIDENKKINNISVFPNPAQDRLNIERSENSIATLTIFNMTGNVILSKKITDKTEIVDISSLSSNTYSFCIETREHKIVRGIFEVTK